MPNTDQPDQPEKRLSTSAAVALVGGATYVSLGIGILRGILYTRLLPSPTSRGIVGIVFIFTTYLSHSHLGIVDGITKRIPRLLGRGDEEEAQRLERAGITAVFLLSLAGASVMWACALLGLGMGETTRWAIGIGGFYLIVMQLATVFRLVLRARQRFRLMARATIMEAIILLGLVVSGSATLDAPGTMVGWAVGLGIVCLYMLSFKVLPTWPLLDVKAAVELARTGVPVLGVNLCHRFLRTIDKVAIVHVLGAGMLGFYDVAWQLSSYLYNVPGAVGEVVTPKVLQAHGEGKQDSIAESVLAGSRALAYLMPPLAGFAAIVAPIMVRLVLPRYIDAIPPLQVLLMAIVFLAIPTALRATLIARNREVEMMVCDVISGVIGGTTVWVLARGDAPMGQLALGAGAGWFLAGALTTWRGLRALDIPAGRTPGLIASMLLPLAYCTAALWVLKGGIPGLTLSSSALISDILALPIFVVLVTPLAWVAEKQTGIISRLRKKR